MSVDRRIDRGQVIRRVAAIGLAVLVMTQVVFMLFPELEWPPEFRAVAIVPEPEPDKPIPAEIGQFIDLKEELHHVSMGEPSPHVVVPTRLERRERRAYEGAPPWIPHPVADSLERTQDCTPCHNFGGYNPGIRTYSPRTPHPEFSNCMQCHVPRVQTDLFAPTDWQDPPWPEFGAGGVLPGGPPRIPHVIALRERCLSCHGGASASPDIRTTHPERFACRQCHLPVVESEAVFTRPSPGGGGGGA